MASFGNGTIGQRLLNLKELLVDKKAERSELQGELKSLKKQLQQDFCVDTVEAAEGLLKEQKGRLESMEETILKKIKEAEEAFEQGGV